MSTIMKNKSLLLLPLGLAILIVIGILTSWISLRQFDPRRLRQLVTGERITLPMSRNRLLLLIAGLAVLVALGIVTS